MRFGHLSRSFALTATSQLLPIACAFAALPMVHAKFPGAEFGVFTLALSAIGFMSILDMGAGRAIVRFMAVCLHAKDYAGARDVAGRTAAYLLVATIVIAASLGAAFYLRISGADRAVATSWAPYSTLVALLLLSSPLFTACIVMRSMLEADEAFTMVALGQTVIGAMTYAAPAVASQFSGDISIICASMLIGRLVGAVGFGAMVRARMPQVLRAKSQPAHAGTRMAVGSFSAWVAVSNIVGAVIVYGDRFIVSSAVPASLIGYYIAPSEIVSKLMVLVAAATTITFPRLSKMSGAGESYRSTVDQIDFSVAAVICPTSLLVVVYAFDLISLWFGADFAFKSSEFVQIFIFGLTFQVFNAFGLNALTARGTVKSMALVHLIEAPIYLGLVYVTALEYGLRGVAIVWSMRMVAEFFVIRYLMRDASGVPTGGAGLLLGSALLAAAGIPSIIFIVAGSAAWSLTIALATSLALLIMAIHASRRRRHAMADTHG